MPAADTYEDLQKSKGAQVELRIFEQAVSCRFPAPREHLLTIHTLRASLVRLEQAYQSVSSGFVPSAPCFADPASVQVRMPVSPWLSWELQTCSSRPLEPMRTTTPRLGEFGATRRRRGKVDADVVAQQVRL